MVKWELGTQNAINSALKAQCSSMSLSVKSWENVTYDMYNFIMNISETKIQTFERVYKEESVKIKSEIQTQYSVLTPEEEAIFDELIVMALMNETSYSLSVDERDIGFNAFIEARKNNSYYVDGNVTMDCSAFASFIMSETKNIYCRRGTVNSYSTVSFKDDYYNFTHDDCTSSGIDVGSLKKGQLILCIDNGGVNHIMVYVGNGMIVHCNATEDGISMDSLNEKTEFLNVENGSYDEIYVLTPDPEAKE